MQGEVAGWGGFAAWAGVGALFGLSAVGIVSIGLLILPGAVVALVVVSRRVRPWPEFAGFLSGAGTGAGLFVGLVNLGSTPCPSSGTGYGSPGGAGPSSSCGGLDPVPWLVVGAALTVVGLVLYLRRSR